jgi:ligand-binding sensor domain-containing protein
MYLDHHSLTLSLMAALCACNLAQDPSSRETPATEQDSASAPGQEVTEIDPRIWVIHQDQSGDYWFGSNGNGVYRYDGERITQYTKADGLSGHQVRDIEEDAKGNVFISTNSGVSKFDGKRFTTLEFIESPASGDAWKLKPDDVWIVFGAGQYGPCRYDGEKLYRLEFAKSPVNDAQQARFSEVNFDLTGVYSIYKDRRGHMWFGTSNVGLCRYDGKALSWMYEERLTTTANGGAFGIRSIYEDRAGDFWITNTRQRFEISPEINVEDGHNLIQYKKKAGLPDSQSDTDKNFTYYPSMTEDKAGVLWMACGNDGVLKYDGEDVTHYSIVNGGYALSILCDREGKLWVGTVEHGIHAFEGAGFEPFMPPAASK